MKTTKSPTSVGVKKNPTSGLTKAEKLEKLARAKALKKEKTKETFKKILPFIIIGVFLAFGATMFFFLPVNKIVNYAIAKSAQIKRELVIKQNVKKAPILTPRTLERDVTAMSVDPVASATPKKEDISITSIIDKLLEYVTRIIGVGSAGIAFYLSLKKLKESKKKKANA